VSKAALILALLLQVCFPAVAKPRTELAEAVRLAETYIAKHHIPNEHRYLASVSWHEDIAHPQKSCWSILWVPNQPGLVDANLVVWVYDNGNIRYQDTWA
jgi:hypothetical protein